MEDILRTERETRKFRLLALLLVAAGVYFQRQEIPVWSALALSLFYLVYLCFLLFTLIRRLPAKWLPYIMLVVDTGFVGGMLYLFGVESAFFVFFPVLIIYYAIYLGYTGSFLSATIVSFTYIGLAYHQQEDLSYVGRLLPMQIPLFYLIAVFSGYIAQKRLNEETERHELALLLQAERGARSMKDLSVDIAAALDPDHLQRQMVRMAVSAAECTHGAIVLLDENTGEPVSPIAVFPEGSFGGRISVPAGKKDRRAKLEQDVLEAGNLLEINSPQPDKLPPWVRSLSPCYVLLAPLAGNHSYRAVLWLLSVTAHEDLSARQRELIGHLVDSFVPLIANAKAYASVRKETERLSSELHGAVSQMTRTQELQKKNDVRCGQFRLEAAQEQAWFGTRRLDLSAREFDVLYILARHGGRPVSQEVLLRDVWGDQSPTRSNVVDVSINRLRRKLASQTSLDDLIQTIRGVGYKLDGDCAAKIEANTDSRGDRGLEDRELTPDSRQNGRQKGALLLEQVISLAVVAMLVPALLATLTTFVNNGDVYHDQVVALELGQAQLESVVKQPFQASPASYSLISSLPNGYSLAVATGEAAQYQYANGSVAPEVLQAITVTVTGRYKTLQVNGYKYRR